jgi:hypothetical protein
MYNIKKKYTSQGGKQKTKKEDKKYKMINNH